MALVVMATTYGSGVAGQMTAAGAAKLSMTLDVDASDAPMKILHATMSMPARAGAMTLFYPEVDSRRAHGVRPDLRTSRACTSSPTARELDWRRDLVEMNAFTITRARRARRR